ncbi:hypothetical protein A6122_0111 [Rathayibacter tritici]|uniref:Carrier domain-containing protein n=1 Tax=Rathayibacter tritici TaxID=33888 RepID=A0A160KQK6_9MICO|nr:hypothetical protein A6122_0111 [Rathayibacter tritici]
MSRTLVTPGRILRPVVDGVAHAVVVPLLDAVPPEDGRMVWHEVCAAPRGSAEAARVVAAEVRRPLAPGSILRLVVLRYAGGEADLVAVSNRSATSSKALLSLAQGVAVGEAPLLESEVAVDMPPATSRRLAPPAGDVVQPFAEVPICPASRDHLLHVELPGSAEDATVHVVAALALVLSRIGRTTQPLLAVHGPEGAESEWTVLSALLVDDSLTVSGFLNQVREALVQPDRHLADIADLDGWVSAGVFATATHGRDERVLPAVDAPFPLTLLPTVRDGQVVLLALARAEAADEADLRARLALIERVYGQLRDATDATVLDDISLTSVPVVRPLHDGLAKAASSAGKEHRRLDRSFADVAAARGDEPAITDGIRILSYRQLDAMASALAAGLRARGVRPGELIGLSLERDVMLVALMIGICRAGATYVPMDPAYPEERLHDMVEDARLRVVVSAGNFPPMDGVLILDPESLASSSGSRALTVSENALPEAGTDAAYVIYTSGSTGRSKGVVVGHESVLALVEATRKDLALGHEDTWTLFHSTAFDFAVWEIWGALLTGARLVVVPYWVTRDPSEFWSLLAREQVTVLNQTPSAFRQLVEADAVCEERLALRLVIFGGEPLDARRLLGWMDRYPERECRLVNMFGITETTVHVTARTVTRGDALRGSRSVGRPLPGWTTSTRDARLRLLPAGVPGEIVVGGVGVAHGYLGRDELTAERFVTDPLTGERLYRSGDLGMLRSDGELEHLGRIDSQVKLRGFRIELGEIAALLERAPDVTEAVVVVGGDVQSDPANARLDAYVVGVVPDVVALRELCGRRLPAHMVPSTFTVLDGLPLTTNGKLDVTALPAPILGAVRVTAGADAPTGAAPEVAAPQKKASGKIDLVEQLQAIWASLLGVPVQPADNFFELGGNSLLAVRLGSVMRDQGLPPLSIRTLYLHATPSALAGALADEVSSAG